MAIHWMNQVWQHSQQSGTSLLVLLALADKADENGEAYPGNKYLAARCRVSARQIRTIIGQLVESGELEIVDPGGKGPKHTRTVRIKGEVQDPLSEKGGSAGPLRGKSSTAKGEAHFRKRGKPTSSDTSIDTSVDTSETLRAPAREGASEEEGKKRRSFKADATRIYQIYPRHVGKKVALRKIEAAIRELSKDHEDPVAWLERRVRDFAKSPAGQAGQFTPHPATWFGQGRYNDDPAEWEIERNGRDLKPGYGPDGPILKPRYMA